MGLKNVKRELNQKGRNMKRWLGVALGVCVLATFAVAKEGDELIGKKAAGWGKLEWVNSEPMAWEKLRDKVVLVRWWTNG